jgi:hypothetical protein
MKQFIFALGIKLLSPRPVPADAGIPRPFEELLHSFEIAFFVPPDLALDQLAHEFGQTFAAAGRFDAGAGCDGIIEGYGHILHRGVH